MMQSINLTFQKKNAIVDDFVIVDDTSSSESSGALFEEDEYDYCDDILGTADNEDDSIPGCVSIEVPFSLEESLEMLPVEESERAPSVVASNLQSENLNCDNDGVANIANCPSELGISQIDDDIDVSSMLAKVEESQATKGEDSVLSHGHESGDRQDSQAIAIAAASPQVPANESRGISQQDSENQALSRQPSRLSNKKRRKQMKLAKKKAATAAALEALKKAKSTPDEADVRPLAGPVSLPKNPPRRLLQGKKSSRRKVANIAVTCATQSLELYREQISRVSKTM